jgi:hypothetical protein
MRPQVVIVTDRFTRIYWLVIGVSVLFFGGLIGLVAAYEILTFHWLF